jgi:FkbM family methyltransferase
MNEALWQQLVRSEIQARSSKLDRLLHHPVLYPFLLFFDYGVYPLMKKGIKVYAYPFFGTRMKTILPSGTDIILNGIKSHDSEIRLSKFLVLHLKEQNTFIDIGAHYGYYSLLASALVGSKGRIFSIEPSAASFRLLKENTSAFDQIKVIHAAAAGQKGEFILYEYPGPYAEYNTTIKDAYHQEKWAKKIVPLETKIHSMVMDDLFKEENIENAFVKIDVEGGEASVIEGMTRSLSENSLVIMMEYLLSKNVASPHALATRKLNDLGYQPFSINAEGTLVPVGDIPAYLHLKMMDSDNIVFIKGPHL